MNGSAAGGTRFMLPTKQHPGKLHLSATVSRPAAGSDRLHLPVSPIKTIFVTFEYSLRPAFRVQSRQMGMQTENNHNYY
jgi:hypothetical protein